MIISKEGRVEVELEFQLWLSYCIAVYQHSERECSCYGTFALTVCLSVHKVYCGKTANWIWMPFGVVSGVRLGMGVLDFGDRRR